jgi:hypothetical protein
METWKFIFRLAFINSFGLSTALAMPCMVLGDRDSVVVSTEGTRSPVFQTSACETLKLKSGKALATWISEDGKPQLAPIGHDGVSNLPPYAPSVHSTGRSVWSEITSQRSTRRQAMMRSLGEVQASPVYIPPEGLELTGLSEKHIQIRSGKDIGAARIIEPIIRDGTTTITRSLIQSGENIWIDVDDGVVSKVYWWTPVQANRLTEYDDAYGTVIQQPLDAQQKNILAAMWFEKMNLSVNKDLMIAKLRKP